MMKRFNLFVLCLCSFIGIMTAQVTTPDFAYPKTVEKNATALLKKANKQKDPHAAINALIQIYIANGLIDPASSQESLKLIQSTTGKYSDSEWLGVFYALQAKIYSEIYSQERWKYDRRQLPLSPLPADLTEWSGEQFKEKIAELSHLSYSNAASLQMISLADCQDIIEANKLTLIYYPTMLDFVCQQAYKLLQELGKDAKAPAECGLGHSKVNSPSSIIWHSNICQLSSDSENAFLKTFSTYKDCEYAAPLLIGYCNDFSTPVWSPFEESPDFGFDGVASEEDPQLLKKIKSVKLIDEFIRRFPACPLADNLINLRSSYTQPTVQVNYPSICGLGAPLNLHITNNNAKEYTLNVYNIPEANLRNRNNLNSYISASSPILSLSLSRNAEAPFGQAIDTIVTLPKAGYYAIMPAIKGQKDNSKRQPSIVRCMAVYPLTLNGCKTSYAVITDPITGLPTNNAGISLTYHNGKTSIIGNTNDNGIIDISKGVNDRIKSLQVTYNGVPYVFSDINPWLNSEIGTRTNAKARILTDRAVYHPGDQTNVMVVASQTMTKENGESESSLLKNHELMVILSDANRQNIDTCRSVTDAFGRISCRFTLPNEGLTGTFRIIVKDPSDNSHYGAGSIIVSDYKLPDFELTDISVARDVPAKGDVTITGRAMTYAGTSLNDANIDVLVSEASWWRWFSPQQQIYSAQATTDTSGSFTIMLSDSIFCNSKGKYFMAQLDCTSSSGTSASASVPFSLGKPYILSLNMNQTNIDGNIPWTIPVKAYNPDGKDMNIPLAFCIKNQKDVIAEDSLSSAPLNLSSIIPGTYTLQLFPKDSSLADTISAEINIYNTNTNIVPGKNPIFVPVTSFTLPQEKKAVTLDILFGTPAPNTAIYYALSDFNNLRKIDTEICTDGYHHLKIEIPADFAGGRLQLFTIKDCQFYSVPIQITRQPKGQLQIIGESFRDRLVPQSHEHWKITILDSKNNPARAALALDMYNHALDAISPHSFGVNFSSYSPYSCLSINNPSRYNVSNLFMAQYNRLKEETLQAPSFNFYGQLQKIQPLFIRGTYMMKSAAAGRANDADMLMYDMAATVECADEAPREMNMAASFASEEEAEEAATKADDNADFDYRDAETPLAIWAPMLTTDGDGNVSYDFTVPNANATWRLFATAWTEQMETGEMMRDMIANKPVMVMPNVPRFLRSGDKTTLLASVINNTDSISNIHVLFEFFNPSTGELLFSATQDYALQANADQIASIPFEAPFDSNAIGFRVKASNGKFSDGEQVVIPILPSEADVIETQPFYLNPSDTLYQTTLPSQQNARISLTFCENPVWSIVSALPGLRNEKSATATSSMAAIFSAAIAKGIMKDNLEIAQVVNHWLNNPSDSALVSMIDKNEDLKQALLSSTPWVEAAQSDNERMANLALIFDSKETNKAINSAIENLSMLQKPDGGWAWGKWCNESSLWITLNVLDRIAFLQRMGFLPSNKKLDHMITLALKYADSKVEDTNLQYSIIRPQFNQTISLNGQKVISSTISNIQKKWKKYSDPAHKAMAAEALWFNSNKTQAHQLMSSISQFGVWTNNQGLRFPSVNSLYDYAILLEAYSLIEPGSKEVDGIRQQLIVRKEGSDWGSSVVTNEVVAGILSSGSKWTTTDSEATIRVDGNAIEAENPIGYAIGDMRCDLSEYGGQTLTITTSGVGPAYGAVYVQFEKLINEISSSKCEELSIEKQMFTRQGTEWTDSNGKFQIGDRVKVQLTIHCTRNLDYVTIIDNRPAAFEPVDQIPGWIYSDGVGFYRENRDTFTGLYVEHMRPGTYLLTYEMNVAFSGSFLSGIATIQSQYAPSISAHSAGTTISCN